MSQAPSTRIHPTAVISADAQLSDDVEVGPYAVIEGRVSLGPGCVVRPHAHLIGPLTIGRGNQIYTGAVIGERPQHMRYTGEPTGIEIGDNNIIREHVTIHQGTTVDHSTRIGHNNFFMANSHVAHDCHVGDHCIFANGALLGGHCLVQDRVYVSGNSCVHQFMRLGRLSLLSGGSVTSKDIAPFLIQHGRNIISGVNVVGMRRSGMTNAQIDAVRRAFHILFLQGLSTGNALTKLEGELGDFDAIRELVGFIRSSTRGINSTRERDELSEAA